MSSQLKIIILQAYFMLIIEYNNYFISLYKYTLIHYDYFETFDVCYWIRFLILSMFTCNSHLNGYKLVDTSPVYKQGITDVFIT